MPTPGGNPFVRSTWVVVAYVGGIGPPIWLQVRHQPKRASGGRGGPEVSCALTVARVLKPLMGASCTENCALTDGEAKTVCVVLVIGVSVKVGGDGLTTNVRVMVCTIAPEVPVTVIVYVPVCVRNVVFISN